MKAQRILKQATILLSAVLLAAGSGGIVGGPTASPALAADFNANLLVSDGTFTARDSMSVQDIQSFLQAKGSVLANLNPNDLGEGANGRSAAQIIYDASRASVSNFGSAGRPSNPFTVSLNPQVILATLQKETSLITGTYTPGSPTLNNMLRIAMGYGCPDSGGCNEDYAGFTNQVSYGGAQLWLSYWRASTGHSSANYKVGQTYSFSNAIYNPYCTSTSMNVTIGNGATGSLYSYTPHVCNGNANFWYFMNQWFPAVFNPTLGKITGQPTIYIIDGGTRYPIDSIETFNALNLNWNNVQTMNGQQQALPVGPMVKQLMLGSDGGTVYLLHNGVKRKVASIRIFQMSGFQWSNVSQPTNLAASIPESVPVYTLARAYGQPAVYMMTNGRGYSFPSAEIFQEAWGYQWGDIGDVPFSAINAFPLMTASRIAKGFGPTIYVMDRGNRLAVPSLELFGHLGIRWDQVTYVDDNLFHEKPEGANLTRLLRGSGPTVYYMENGSKRPIASVAAFNRMNLNWNDVRQVSDSLINTFPTGSTIR